MSLLYVEKLTEVLETILYTGGIRGETPVSTIIVGPSGVGKSWLLKAYGGPQIHRTDSITQNGLYRIMQQDRGNKLRYLILPDFNPTMSRRPSTVNALVANLLSATSDGMVRVDDGREDKVCEHAPIGLLTSCTTEVYGSHAKKWYNLGLRRRIIPIFYDYGQDTEDKLLKDHTGAVTTSPPKASKNGFSFAWYSIAIPENHFDAIEQRAKHLAIFLGKKQTKRKDQDTGRVSYRWEVDKVKPISPRLTLENLTRAHARRRSSAKVEQCDIDFLDLFLSFCDYQAPRQL